MLRGLGDKGLGGYSLLCCNDIIIIYNTIQYNTGGWGGHREKGREIKEWWVQGTKEGCIIYSIVRGVERNRIVWDLIV